MSKCAIFILTQNTEVKKQYLKTTLYFLFRNYNKKYNHPVIILHEGDYDDSGKEEILKGVRLNYRHLIKFTEIAKEDFSVPDHIDRKRLDQIVEIQPVPYWRNVKYRSMCYFWVKNFFKYTEGYDYVMRIDDDSIIEEPVNEDFFEIMKSKDLVYISNIIHMDCGLCNYGMKNMFLDIFPEHRDKIEKDLFTEAALSAGDVFQKFKRVHEIASGKEFTGDCFKLDMPFMYYNNFFVSSTKFWMQDDVKQAIDKIDKNGGIFYYRYGDAPIHTILCTLLAPEKISRAVFKYSKRMQREAFIDSHGSFHSYMPRCYNGSSCITQK